MHAIELHKVIKTYQLRSGAASNYTALRDVVGSIFTKQKKQSISFNAIDDLSFNIETGDRVGIIGRNGAGKSTLLKLLSRVTAPSKGIIKIKGRIASLLEVGTGFHPELTGRENIYLNGAILGMNREEIKRKFDEIVAFAEVDQFLDTPVKRYSSGMYVKLAFAVAAHLEPEILIIDEVLAVGDASFQRKCLAKMEDISKGQGRTVLFVSHNMATIQHLCNKCIYLKQGKLVSQGATADVVSHYLRDISDHKTIDLKDRKDRQGNADFLFTGYELLNNKMQQLVSFQTGQTAVLRLIFSTKINFSFQNFHIALGIDDDAGMRIAHFNTEVVGFEFEANQNYVDLLIDKMPFRQGMYTVTLYAASSLDVNDWLPNAFSFFVDSGDYFGTGKLPPSGQGSIYVPHQFQGGVNE
ncbi:MAG: hypothetical protein RIQ89_514 [Bacteroidota bacterium]|jgi:lipopolysaccharide transport system ATP-binding protein